MESQGGGGGGSGGNSGGGGGSGSTNNNSSDFVRKLYKMLEDPSYSQVVRWGDEGDSFVVLENEKFTKSILPKHFKHSNFASFVRQLNKYDFHKVRQNNEENGQSPYGPGAWEFKHPEFKANNKDSLDNIRRKAPAPRKSNQIAEEAMPMHQVDLMNTQLLATQQQLQSLQERYNELNAHHSMVLQELVNMQRTVVNHDHIMQDVMSYLHSLDARTRRDSRTVPFTQGSLEPQTPATVDLSQQGMPPLDDQPATPLQHATKLLNDFNPEVQLNVKSLEHMNELASRTNGWTSTPPPDGATRANGAIRQPTSAASSTSMGYAKLSNEYDNTVYPMGNNMGIDPTYGEHVNNIPYPMPAKELDQADPRKQYAEGRKKSTYIDPGWIRPPSVLLVEDDPTCRQIGGKFLLSFHCTVETALDGLEAVDKIQNGSRYDLILMDIIMPNLDGVSACHLIRQIDRSPIIAMTSNIRSDDIQMYFQHGMDDVLPKPFTKKSLLEMLEKHLTHMKKGAEGLEPPLSATAHSMTHTSASQSVKDDSSPGQSPATSMNNWQSPGQYPGVSPMHASVQNQYIQAQTPTSYSMDQNGVPYQNPQTPINAARQGQHRRQVSEMSSGAEAANFPKRQRVFASGGGVPNQMQTARPA